MFPFTTILNSLSIMLSLSTASGVLIHDTKIDKATAAAIAPLAVTANYETTDKLKISGDPHTHSERGSLSQAVRDLKQQNPRLLPRAVEDRKHIVQRKLPFQLGNDSATYSFYS